MPADAHAGPVRAGDHHGRVPPDIGPDPAFDVLVAGEPRLALRRDRVDEVGAAQAGHPDLLLARPLEQAEHHVPGAGPASGAHDRIERLDPFARLVRVDVGQLGRQPVADDRELLTSGSHGVASPSAVSRAAGRPRERIPRCVVQTNRRTNWPIAHLYLTVTGPAGGFAPHVPPKTSAAGRFRHRRTRTRGGFARGRILWLLYVMRAAVRNQQGGRAGQFMVAVCQPGAIATCAPGRPSVNCPNKKC